MTEEFGALAKEIAREMGAGWTLTEVGSRYRPVLRMAHTDGRAVDLWPGADKPGRLGASGVFPETGISVKQVITTAAVSRGAAAIARQINGARFMGVYTSALARVREHNEREERREAARTRTREMLTQYIPEETGGMARPEIKTSQAYEKTDEDGWGFTDRVVVALEFRDLTPDQARMIMRAYSVTMGHTPDSLRKAV